MYYIENRNGRLRIVDNKGATVLQKDIGSGYLFFMDSLMRDIIINVNSDGTLLYKRRSYNPIRQYRYHNQYFEINLSRLPIEMRETDI